MKMSVSDMDIRCPQCGAHEFITDTVYSSGVVLRCARCTQNRKPTYVKNVSKASLDRLKNAGRIRGVPSIDHVSPNATLGVVNQTTSVTSTPSQSTANNLDVAQDSIDTTQMPFDACQLHPKGYSSGSLSVPDVVGAVGVDFNKPRCRCCDTSLFGTGYDDFGMPVQSVNINLLIRDKLLLVRSTLVGQDESGISIPVSYCPVCGRKV